MTLIGSTKCMSFHFALSPSASGKPPWPVLGGRLDDPGDHGSLSDSAVKFVLLRSGLKVLYFALIRVFDTSLAG
jgi:hypothetical protein